MVEVVNSKVILEGYIIVSDGDLPRVLQELPNHIRLTKEEEGCLSFSVLQRPDEPNAFDVFEEFADRTAFETHQRRSRRSVWGEITANVERHYEVKGII